MNYSLSSFAPENLFSRDGFGGPISRQLAHLHTPGLNLVLAYGIPPEFRGGVHSLSVHIMYYEFSSAYMYSSTYYDDISSTVSSCSVSSTNECPRIK